MKDEKSEVQKLVVRLPKSFKVALKKKAKENNRSMNREIISMAAGEFFVCRILAFSLSQKLKATTKDRCVTDPYKVLVRFPESIHASITKKAKASGISLNRFIVNAVADGCAVPNLTQIMKKAGITEGCTTLNLERILKQILKKSGVK